jgi:type 1 glutamine amidotransferase/sugar phosphate isomerase/epimerase
MEFITGGGGLLGVHGTTVAFTRWPGAVEDWPEFGFLIGARGANHKDSTERVWIGLDDPEHPLNRIFGGQGFEYRDEFFRAQGTYSRRRVRVVLSLDTSRTDVTQGQPRGDCYRADNDYALAWVRNYGRGRVFYSTIAHNPYVFWDAKLLRFYLGAIQFALGDLAAPTTPSAALTPAVRAQEKLGWRLGLEAGSLSHLSFFSAVEKTAELGLTYIGGSSEQQVSQNISRKFDPKLTDAELVAIRLKLESAGLRLLTYRVRSLPGDEAGCRTLFEFGRKMGLETLVLESSPNPLDTVARFCDEYGINVALSSSPPRASQRLMSPRDLVKLCAGRTRRIGVCADLGAWMRANIDPIQAVRILDERLITVQMPEWQGPASGSPGPTGKEGTRWVEQVLNEIQLQKQRPTMFALEFARAGDDGGQELSRGIEFFNTATLKLGR